MSARRAAARAGLSGGRRPVGPACLAPGRGHKGRGACRGGGARAVAGAPRLTAALTVTTEHPGHGKLPPYVTGVEVGDDGKATLYWIEHKPEAPAAARTAPAPAACAPTRAGGGA